MEEYKKAFVCRKAGRFGQGRLWLHKSFERGNMYAALELWCIYICGGWGVGPNEAFADFYLLFVTKATKNDPLLQMLFKSIGPALRPNDIPVVLSRAIEEGVHLRAYSAMAKLYVSIDKNVAVAYLQRGAEEGCADCCYRLYNLLTDEKVRLDYLTRACDQMLADARNTMFEQYWDLRNFKAAMQFYDKGNSPSSVLSYFLRQCCCPESYYFVGRAITDFIDGVKFPEIKTARQYYERMIAKVRSAVITWLCIAKKLNSYKDIAQMIGKLVFESRETPSIWECKLLKLNKRIKQ